MAFDKTLRSLNDCGCCDGVIVQTPVQIYNRPGLTALVYRVGNHEKFKQTLIARLSGSGQTALRSLTTRDNNDDLSIALLDAWSIVSDVLTFYQERIINESYLRTSIERKSLLELARLIGYELSPGVAANTYLAFTIEDTPGAFGEVLNTSTTAQNKPTQSPPVFIDVGMKVQSVPGPGEKAQTFETIEKIEARAEWNNIKPSLTQRHPVKEDTDSVIFEGLTTGLKLGDGLLLHPNDDKPLVFRLVDKVIPENKMNRTKVQLQTMDISPISGYSSISNPSMVNVASSGASSPSISKEWMDSIGVSLKTPISSDVLHAHSVIDKFKVQDIFANLAATQKPPPSILAFRTKAAIFGHNAPSWDSLPHSQRFGEYGHKLDPSDPTKTIWEFTEGAYKDRKETWAEVSLNNYDKYIGSETINIYLDNVYSNIVKNSFVVLKDGPNEMIKKVNEISEVSISDFTFNAKVSCLTLDKDNGFDNFTIRDTSVYGQSEELTLARIPKEDVISNTEIELNTWVDGLFEGQRIILCGELDDKRGVKACEVVIIEDVEHILGNEGFTQIKLREPLKNTYVRDTVTINANVALATHGETVQEVLGSGDATQLFQKFTLRQPPLTFVSASTPGGIETTLEVRVNDLLWKEVASFYGHGPDERIYITRIDDTGKTTVIFGDGKTGARLLTGQENVKVRYRKGIGLQGLVKENQLSQLMTRPLGLKAATNPIASSDAADSESISDARRNAPLTVMTLDRTVSLQDYEDFARAFAGIDKALATWSWNGMRRSVFVTVAGSKGAEVKEDSKLYDNLLKAMRKYGDPNVPLQIKSYRPRLFRVKGVIEVKSDFVPEKVLSAVKEKMHRSFSFGSREFEQPVKYSEVTAVIQNVPGVNAVNVRKLYYSNEEPDLNDYLLATIPAPGDKEIFAAELLTLDPRPLELEVMP